MVGRAGMNASLPHPILDQLQKLCVRDRSPAYVLVAPGGELLDWGGFCENYGLAALAKGSPATDQVYCLEGLLPLGGAAQYIPFVEFTPGVTADLYLIPGEQGDWILFLDSTVEAHRISGIQQGANELALSRSKERKLLAELHRGHRNLLKVFNQLRLITAIIDSDGRIAFLSEHGRDLLLKRGHKAVGRSWEEVFRLGEKQRRDLRNLLQTPPGARSRLQVSTQAAGGARRWFEIDVQDDPASAMRKILYFYDITDLRALREQLRETTHFRGILGKSAGMQRVFNLVGELAGMDSTVLIEGETGTGKELVAKAIHDTSPRKAKPFITVNCAGLSDSLINSQLFGHRKGSFTDAVSDQEGVFEAADGGTILLDEIGDIPLNTQTRILRVLEQREIVRVGETKPRKIRLRILTATHKDLEAEVRRGRFRADLLYRIRVARVRLPALRERREDIPVLAEAFLERAKASTGKTVTAIAPDALRMLMDYTWPGNVRELRNAIEFAVISCRGMELGVIDLPPEVLGARGRRPVRRDYDVEAERQRILEALERTHGRRAAAANLLGISRATLYRRMRECLLDPFTIPRPPE